MSLANIQVEDQLQGVCPSLDPKRHSCIKMCDLINIICLGVLNKSIISDMITAPSCIFIPSDSNKFIITFTMIVQNADLSAKASEYNTAIDDGKSTSLHVS
jgi:hypothetical protein